MSLHQLRHKIEQRQAVLGVIGLGYVGLPVACTFARAGFNVIGVDLKPDRVAMINAGRSPIGGYEPGLAELLAEVIAAGSFHATLEYAELSRADVILIDVETPIDEQHQPNFAALEAACRSLGSVLKEDALIIVESTIAPGTLERVVRPLIEQASGRQCHTDFYLGACPERITPGKLLINLRLMSRVCGGGTPETSETMIALYRHIVAADLDPADWVTAELVKTAENAYRDVNIAFANELALICEASGGDFLRVRELVNKSPGRNVLLAGAGVGGHCIPKDPWLLVKPVSRSARLIPAARSINDAMPLHVVELIVEALKDSGRAIDGAQVTLLGYAYLENSDDTRHSPSTVAANRLYELGARVVIHDPWVQPFDIDVWTCLKNSDAAVLMVAHEAYRHLDVIKLKSILRTPIVIDGRRLFDPAAARSAGLIYRAVGLART